jgi:hypothetical protein
MALHFLFYDAGRGEIYRSSDDLAGLSSQPKVYPGWRSNWKHIIPGHFGGRHVNDLLFYDGAGTAEFYTVSDEGEMTLFKTYTDWVSPGGRPWTHIHTGRFTIEEPLTYSNLMFYDSRGNGAFYKTYGEGEMKLIKEHTGWFSPAGHRHPWTHFNAGPAGVIAGISVSGILFYDSAGTGRFYTSDGHGGIDLLREYTGWVSPNGLPWTHICLGSFGYLFYDAASTAALYEIKQENAELISLKTQNWGSSAGLAWKQILSFWGWIGTGFVPALLGYDGAGTGEFYTVDQQGDLHLVGGSRQWRSTWTHIVTWGHHGSGE